MKGIFQTFFITMLITFFFYNCHNVTIQLNETPKNETKLKENDINHYTTLMGWLEVSDVQIVHCNSQLGVVEIKEDFIDAIIYTALAPFVISESINVKCKDTK